MKKKLAIALGGLLGATVLSLVLLPSFVPMVARADTFLSGFLRDGSGNLDVNCQVGCGGGGASAPLSGTSDTQSTAANQAIGGAVFNGTTWDRAREGSTLGSDLVTVGGTLPAFAATPTVLSQPMVGTLMPANGSAPKNATACTNIIPTVASPSMPTVLVDINFISPTSLPAGASLEIFDETTATCSSGGTKIQLSTGQIGAGYKLGSPIVLSSGLSYQINTPGGFTFGTGYGLRFRTVP